MPIKLLAMDLDGTLITDLHTIPPRTKDAIRAAVDKGVYVIIATGREYEITKEIAHQLDLNTPIICFQGALIYDPQTNKIIASTELDLPLAQKLIDFSRLHNLALYLYLNSQAYAEHTTGLSRAMFDETGTPVVEVSNLKDVIISPPIKGLIVHPVEGIDAKIEELRVNLGSGASVFRSVDKLIEITSPNTSKGHALSTLAAYYNIPQAEVMAIGDQDNDIDMIAWAGIGIAVGNASPKAKSVADYIAPPVEQEGVVWAIEQFILHH